MITTLGAGIYMCSSYFTFMSVDAVLVKSVYILHSGLALSAELQRNHAARLGGKFNGQKPRKSIITSLPQCIYAFEYRRIPASGYFWVLY